MYVLNLSDCGTYGLVDIGSFTVHLTVHGIAHLLDDPDIFQIHERHMGFHDI